MSHHWKYWEPLSSLASGTLQGGITFSPAITLPCDFSHQGYGGLCAVNRTMDTQALCSGLRNETLDSICCPRSDPQWIQTDLVEDVVETGQIR